MRPALVISSDDLNESGAGPVIVAPLTTAQRSCPSRVRIPAGASGMRETSWAAVEHLRSLSVLRLREYRGSAGGQILDEVGRVVTCLRFEPADGDHRAERVRGWAEET